MARPIDQARHREVVLAAFEALRRRGVVGVTMADLAGDLGMGRSALYWYFAGLGELFEAVLELVLDRQGGIVAAEVLSQSHPLDQIAAWMRTTVRIYHDDPGLLAVLLQLWATARPDAPDATLAVFRARFEPLHALACEQIEAGIAAGDIAPCQPRALVDLCAAVVDGALVHRLSRGIDSLGLIEEFLDAVVWPLRQQTGVRQPTRVRPPPKPLPKPVPRRTDEDWPGLGSRPQPWLGSDD